MGFPPDWSNQRQEARIWTVPWSSKLRVRNWTNYPLHTVKTHWIMAFLGKNDVITMMVIKIDGMLGLAVTGHTSLPYYCSPRHLGFACIYTQFMHCRIPSISSHWLDGSERWENPFIFLFPWLCVCACGHAWNWWFWGVLLWWIWTTRTGGLSWCHQLDFSSRLVYWECW